MVNKIISNKEEIKTPRMYNKYAKQAETWRPSQTIYKWGVLNPKLYTMNFVQPIVHRIVDKHH